MASGRTRDRYLDAARGSIRSVAPSPAPNRELDCDGRPCCLPRSGHAASPAAEPTRRATVAARAEAREDHKNPFGEAGSRNRKPVRGRSARRIGTLPQPRGRRVGGVTYPAGPLAYQSPIVADVDMSPSSMRATTKVNSTARARDPKSTPINREDDWPFPVSRQSATTR